MTELLPKGFFSKSDFELWYLEVPKLDIPVGLGS